MRTDGVKVPYKFVPEFMTAASKRCMSFMYREDGIGNVLILDNFANAAKLLVHIQRRYKRGKK